MNQPKLSFWQIWNVSFGFLGVQIGFALQNGNVSRILTDLGADLSSLSLFWLAAPIMGLLVQPIVGALSDKTWNGLGRRLPFILGGAIVAAGAMALLPNASMVVAFLPPMIFGLLIFAIKDAAFNVTFQPFRSLVSDMVPAEQRNLGYSVQTLLINIGAVVGSILPFVLTNVVGLDNVAEAGQVAPSVIWAFYIGATILLGSVLWTVFRTKEYAPEDYYKYKGMDIEKVQAENEQDAKKSMVEKVVGLWQLIKASPEIMKQLALVQFFSWFALFIMWTYLPAALTQHVWGVGVEWFDPAYLATHAVPDAISQAKGAAGDWVGILYAAQAIFSVLFAIVLTKLANKFGRKLVYSLSLLAGGLGYLSMFLFQDTTLVTVDLLITQVTVAEGAIGIVLSMIGVGIAWSAILAMPYAILAGALPADKTGVYMGIFNFTIAAPQIVSGIVSGWVLGSIFANQAINIIMLAGVCMILGAFSVGLVKDQTEATQA
ncbi:MFS transporter [Psychrosphaera sp. B3R10]|uniref:MFS transporter n=1 Tax=unclassified Psychrosphaera TaxID=2641570 RepID=UPI001C085C67|nr:MULTISPECIES: MFS transporter [unclassified Psychrosphaera]MBU2880704.1 MFS transporter [Psychrosphaera sp. I2R16]MBU2991550.1 MFS transporter [Psychrosphaera sp. B3R10]MDO6719442.1 MFS transporter [Psychrosphaera sp. 1_MG-2023]